jgi:hypothetical protein
MTAMVRARSNCKRTTDPLVRERMLHKDCDRKCSVEKKVLVVSLEGFLAKTN